MATPQCTWNGWLLALCKHVKHACGSCSAGGPITSRLLPDYPDISGGRISQCNSREEGSQGEGGGVAQVFGIHQLVKLLCVKLLPGDGATVRQHSVLSPTQI